MGASIKKLSFRVMWLHCFIIDLLNRALYLLNCVTQQTGTNLLECMYPYLKLVNLLAPSEPKVLVTDASFLRLHALVLFSKKKNYSSAEHGGQVYTTSSHSFRQKTSHIFVSLDAYNIVDYVCNNAILISRVLITCMSCSFD